MGSLTCRMSSGTTPKQFLDREIGSSVVKSAVKRNVYYAAVRVDAENENQIVAVVIPFSVSRGDISFKTMDESMGPHFYDCPESILSLLTAPVNSYASSWREKCRAMISARKLAAKIRSGDIVTFAETISYGIHGMAKTFVYAPRTVNGKTKDVWWCPDLGMHVRISGWKDRLREHVEIGA
jgi:hypothetical protein